ncbi:MAG TPA: hypothetical protein VEI25_13460 [Paraburkholderia sp.]|nr:hypothetical protein [Paraburkholderia sp.]
MNDRRPGDAGMRVSDMGRWRSSLLLCAAIIDSFSCICFMGDARLIIRRPCARAKCPTSVWRHGRDAARRIKIAWMDPRDIVVKRLSICQAFIPKESDFFRTVAQQLFEMTNNFWMICVA